MLAPSLQSRTGQFQVDEVSALVGKTIGVSFSGRMKNQGCRLTGSPLLSIGFGVNATEDKCKIGIRMGMTGYLQMRRICSLMKQKPIRPVMVQQITKKDPVDNACSKMISYCCVGPIVV